METCVRRLRKKEKKNRRVQEKEASNINSSNILDLKREMTGLEQKVKVAEERDSPEGERSEKGPSLAPMARIVVRE